MDDLPHRKLEFAALLKGDQSRLYGYIHSLVRDLNDTDDLFQQVALILWQKFDAFDRERSFFAWACGIARFETANFLRRRGRQRLYFSDDLNLLLIEANEALASDETEARRETLTRCVEKLRERDRALLHECYAEDANIPGSADKYGRSPQSVYNSLRRIRRALFECIGQTLAKRTQPG